jgi:hypothetical protein
MAHQSVVSLTTFRELIDTISASYAKSKAMAAVAVSTDLAEYKSDIISDYLNALFQFIEEGHASLLMLQERFFNVINIEEKVNSGKK